MKCDIKAAISTNCAFVLTAIHGQKLKHLPDPNHEHRNDNGFGVLVPEQVVGSIQDMWLTSEQTTIART